MHHRSLDRCMRLSRHKRLQNVNTIWSSSNFLASQQPKLVDQTGVHYCIVLMQNTSPKLPSSRLKTLQVSTVTSANIYRCLGIDNSWDHEKWKQEFKVGPYQPNALLDPCLVQHTDVLARPPCNTCVAAIHGQLIAQRHGNRPLVTANSILTFS